MNHNRSPRLHDFWKYVCWLKDDSAGTGALAKFFGPPPITPAPATPPAPARFTITCPASAYTHRYELPDAYRNIFKPAKEAIPLALQGVARADMLLYKLGDEEPAHLIKVGSLFKGIVVVRTKLAMKFTNGGAGVWDFNQSLAWAQALKGRFNSLNTRLRLSSSGTNDFDNVYVHFVPHFAVYSGVAVPAGSYWQIEVVKNGGGAFSTAGTGITCDSGPVLAMANTQSKIVRYCFGLSSGAGALTKTDFPKIVEWMSRPDVGNATFTMSDF